MLPYIYLIFDYMTSGYIRKSRTRPSFRSVDRSQRTHSAGNRFGTAELRKLQRRKPAGDQQTHTPSHGNHCAYHCSHHRAYHCSYHRAHHCSYHRAHHRSYHRAHHRTDRGTHHRALFCAHRAHRTRRGTPCPEEHSPAGPGSLRDRRPQRSCGLFRFETEKELNIRNRLCQRQSRLSSVVEKTRKEQPTICLPFSLQSAIV